jgi:2-hydroxy-3-oxopropionate reductase
MPQRSSVTSAGKIYTVRSPLRGFLFGGRPPIYSKIIHPVLRPGGDMREKIGFIGVGTMGKPMALNLMKAGYELSVYDKNPKPLREFQEKGATVGQSIRAVASKSEVIITMVPNSGDVEDVILKENGAIEGLKSGSTVIDMSTIDPTVSRKIWS